MRLKNPVSLLLLTTTLLVSSVSAQTLSFDRPRLASPELKSYVNPELKIQYNLEKAALEAINRTRAEKGLSQLEWNEKVAQVARLHSENMAHYKFFNHRGLDGLMVNERADSIGLPWQAIGENIAYNRGYDDPVGFTVKRWMESPSHKDNIMDRRWRETGIGVIAAPDGTYYLTQVFLRQ